MSTVCEFYLIKFDPDVYCRAWYSPVPLLGTQDLRIDTQLCGYSVVLWHVWEEEKFGSNHIRIVGLLCLTILPLAQTVQQCFPAIRPWRNPKHFFASHGTPSYENVYKDHPPPPQKKWQFVAHGDYYSVANYRTNFSVMFGGIFRSI
jgi:hypothetical protein